MISHHQVICVNSMKIVNRKLDTDEGESDKDEEESTTSTELSA